MIGKSTTHAKKSVSPAVSFVPFTTQSQGSFSIEKDTSFKDQFSMPE